MPVWLPKTIYKMKGMFFLLCILLHTSTYTIHAQSLRGAVLKFNSNKQPLPGAQVSTPDASPTISASDGTFELIYRNKTAGSSVQMKVEKTGMEVVNSKDLVTRLRKEQTEEIQVFMCPKGETDRRRITFYNINEKNLTKQYEERLAKLRRERQDNQTILVELEQQYKAALGQIKDYAEKFAVVNLDFVSEKYRAAFVLFEKGEFEQAIQVLDENQLKQDLEKAQNEISAAAETKEMADSKRRNGIKARNQVIQDYLLKGQLLVIQLRSEDAERVFNRAVEIDPSQYESLFELANFYQLQAQYEPSIVFFEKAQANATDDYDKINALNALGATQRLNKNFAASAAEFSKVIAILDPLIQPNTTTYKINLAMVLINQGALLMEIDKPKEAQNALERAVELSQFVNKSPGNSFTDIEATACSNLGMAYKSVNQFDKAQLQYERALSMFETLSLKHGNKYRPDVADMLSKVGVIYFEQNKVDKSLAALQKSLQIYDELAQKNPAAYNLRLLHSLSNLGATLDDLNKPSDAEAYLVRAETLANTMADNNPMLYLPEKAEVWTNLGYHYLMTDPSKGKAYFEENLRIWEKLVKEQPTVYASKHGKSLINLGLVNLMVGNVFDGVKILERGVLIYEKLYQENPEKYRSYLASAYSSAANGYGMAKQPEKVVKILEKAYQLNSELAVMNPEVYLPDKAKTAHELATHYFGSNQTQLGVKALKEATDIYEALVKTVPDKYDVELGMCLLLHSTYIEIASYLQTRREEDYQAAMVLIDRAESLASKSNFMQQQGLAELITQQRKILLEARADKTTQPAQSTAPMPKNTPPAQMAESTSMLPTSTETDPFVGTFVNLTDNGSSEIRLKKNTDGSYEGEIYTLGINTASISAQSTPNGIAGKAKALFSLKFQMQKNGDKYIYTCLGIEVPYMKKEDFEKMKQLEAQQQTTQSNTNTSIASTGQFDQRLIGTWKYSNTTSSGSGSGSTYSETITFYPDGTCSIGTGYTQDGINAGSGPGARSPFSTEGNQAILIGGKRLYYSFEYSNTWGWILGLRPNLQEKEKIYQKL